MPTWTLLLQVLMGERVHEPEDAAQGRPSNPPGEARFQLLAHRANELVVDADVP